MVNLAVLHSTLPTNILEEGKNLTVQAASDNLKDFIDTLKGDDKTPDVLILDMKLLGDAVEEGVNKLEQAFKPEITVIVYDFAKAELIDRLATERRHIVRSPLAVRDLKAMMLNLIVRDLMSGGGAKAPAAAGKAGNADSIIPDSRPPQRFYTDQDLTMLQTVSSAVDCECPNQISHLVIALNNFENYSKHCENKSEEDAKIHNMLYRATGQARAIMEEATRRLCEFEDIDLKELKNAANS
ncbi:MAG: hypothetical protein R3270_05905 [Gammaproteobacteria bacterium]|nr:hypothetical protein [Gammaproteobacteria bacterium]